jgi:hypothetical protein
MLRFEHSLLAGEKCTTVWTHSYIIGLMTGTEMVLEILVVFNQPTQMMDREGFINVSYPEIRTTHMWNEFEK